MLSMDHFRMRIPHLYMCPISLDLFSDPVTLVTGQTYERSRIERWFADGNDTCPVTMQKLHDFTVVPNHTLRHLIDNWLLMEAQSDSKDPKSVEHSPSVASLKLHLQSPETSVESKLDIIRKINVFAEESQTRKFCLVQLGFLPVLLDLIFGCPESRTTLFPEDSELADEGLCCVLNLLRSASDEKFEALNILKQSPYLDSLVNLLEHGGMAIKVRVCNLVEEISSVPQTHELSLILGRTERLLRGLVCLLYCRKHLNASNASTRAIAGLCLLGSNHEDIITCGAIDGLIASLSQVDNNTNSCALSAIEMLSIHESGKRALIDNEKAVQILVKMLFRVSNNGGSETAAGLLLDICQSSTHIQQVAIRAGAIVQILFLLQSQCSEKTKTKARMLLKLLRSIWIEDPFLYGVQYGVVESWFFLS